MWGPLVLITTTSEPESRTKTMIKEQRPASRLMFGAFDASSVPQGIATIPEII